MIPDRVWVARTNCHEAARQIDTASTLSIWGHKPDADNCLAKAAVLTAEAARVMGAAVVDLNDIGALRAFIQQHAPTCGLVAFEKEPAE
jgi:hypothetical protein